MRAPFAYFGGKMGMAQRIISLMPPHRVYMEPFFGSGAVFFAKPKVSVEILNDLDDGVVSFFRALRDDPDELERLCALSPHARSEFDAGLEPTDDPMEQARRFWVRVNQSFAKTAGGNTGWSVTTARNQSVPGSIRSRVGRFAATADRLMGASIERCDAADLIDRLAGREALAYVDPPYLSATRSDRDSDYTVDMGDEESHRRLAKALHNTPASVILSGYPSPLYDDLYGGWHRIDIPVHVHSSNAVTVKRGQRTEVLWLNFEPAAGQLPLGDIA
jgi:DNA adenine methylase